MTDEKKPEQKAKIQSVDNLFSPNELSTETNRLNVDGSVDVHGNYLPGSQIAYVIILIYQPGETPDPSSNGAIRADVDSGTGVFGPIAVQNARGNTAGDHVNNLKIWGYDTSNNLVVGSEYTTSFKGEIAASMTVEVSAKHCVMFAWAPADYIGPEAPDNVPRERGPEHIPTRIAVPTNASGVTITTADWGEDKWTHAGEPNQPNSGPRTGPEGRTGHSKTTRGTYKNAAYGSENTRAPENLLNRLIGLWQSGPNMPGTVFDIGEGVENSPRQGDFLFLGMHDGFEWANNYGQGTVTITWT